MRKFSPPEIAKILWCRANQSNVKSDHVCRKSCPFYVENSKDLSQRELCELAAYVIDCLAVEANKCNCRIKRDNNENTGRDQGRAGTLRD